MNQTIQEKKPIVWCKLKGFYGREQEILYWDGTEENFGKLLKGTYIKFHRYGRNVYTSSIEDFGEVKDIEKFTLDMKIAHLSDEHKQDVKERIKQMKSNIGRSPTPSEIDKIIVTIVRGPQKQETEEIQPISSQERLKLKLRIYKQKVAKVTFHDFFFFEKLKTSDFNNLNAWQYVPK